MYIYYVSMQLFYAGWWIRADSNYPMRVGGGGGGAVLLVVLGPCTFLYQGARDLQNFCHCLILNIAVESPTDTIILLFLTEACLYRLTWQWWSVARMWMFRISNQKTIFSKNCLLFLLNNWMVQVRRLQNEVCTRFNAGLWYGTVPSYSIFGLELINFLTLSWNFLLYVLLGIAYWT